jgi:hypothetical protein
VLGFAFEELFDMALACRDRDVLISVSDESDDNVRTTLFLKQTTGRQIG